MDNKAACLCCVGVTLVVLLVVGLFVSAGTVEPIAYGLNYN